jgi:hypothetical protein
MTDEPLLYLAAITIDCPDPMILAEFYARAFGGEVGRRRIGEGFDPDNVWLELGPLRFIFRRDREYRAPTWPEHEVPAGWHFDCYVYDVEATEKRLHDLGARTAAHQPSEPADDFHLVMLDPAGRPFCISEMP